MWETCSWKCPVACQTVGDDQKDTCFTARSPSIHLLGTGERGHSRDLQRRGSTGPGNQATVGLIGMNIRIRASRPHGPRLSAPQRTPWRPDNAAGIEVFLSSQPTLSRAQAASQPYNMRGAHAVILVSASSCPVSVSSWLYGRGGAAGPGGSGDQFAPDSQGEVSVRFDSSPLGSRRHSLVAFC